LVGLGGGWGWGLPATMGVQRQRLLSFALLQLLKQPTKLSTEAFSSCYQD
jgi:hypothetical protein